MNRNQLGALLSKSGVTNHPYAFEASTQYPDGFSSIGRVVEPDRDWKIYVATTLNQEIAAQLIRDGENPNMEIPISRGMRGVEKHLLCVIKLESEYGVNSSKDQWETITVSTQDLTTISHKEEYLKEILAPGKRIGYIQIPNGSTSHPYDEWIVPDPNESTPQEIDDIYDMYQ